MLWQIAQLPMENDACRFVYRLKDWHYYMYEFCYVAILIGVIHTSLFPQSAFLYKVRTGR